MEMTGITTNKMNEDPNPGAGTLYVHGESVTPIPVTWEEILKVSLAAKPLFFTPEGGAGMAMKMEGRMELIADSRGTLLPLHTRCITRERYWRIYFLTG
jgi:hypothetical protein